MPLGQFGQGQSSPEVTGQELLSSKGLLWVGRALTVVVSIDRAHQAEELNDPAEAVLHLKNKDAGQNLEERTRPFTNDTRGGQRLIHQAPDVFVLLTDNMFLDIMTATL